MANSNSYMLVGQAGSSFAVACTHNICTTYRVLTGIVVSPCMLGGRMQKHVALSEKYSSAGRPCIVDAESTER